MKCAWQELLGILPDWMRRDVDELGRETLQEIRLRCGQVPILRCHGRAHSLKRTVSRDDIHYIVNIASRYSPWSAATAAMGYITAPGGHRIGICGEAVVQDGHMSGIRYPSSLCIRIARDFPGVAMKAGQVSGSILIIGPPGAGKTTLLRDLIRQRARKHIVCVVDERGEIFPNGFFRGENVDVLSGVHKQQGIERLLRAMAPTAIAVDEITSEEDCAAMKNAGWCGVDILATAHAASLDDLRTRPIYRPVLRSNLFSNIIVLHADKSWHLERMTSCT